MIQHWDTKTTTFKGGCRHWRTEVKIGEYTILASGLMDRPAKGLPGPKPWPDAAVYLDRSWLSHLGGIVSAGIDAPIEPWWPFIIADWTDQGALNADYYAALVDRIIGMLEAGQRVEIACQGGHGRTGTLIAGVLAKVEGLGAQAAIDSLRKRYCGHVVESHAQVTQIYTFLGEKPPTKPRKSTTYAKGDCTCGHEELLHIESGGACVDCECEGYSTRKSFRPKTWDQDQCACRHIRRNHADKSGNCRKCGCSGFRLGAVAGEMLV